jgi:hypothetical protein
VVGNALLAAMVTVFALALVLGAHDGWAATWLTGAGSWPGRLKGGQPGPKWNRHR